MNSACQISNLVGYSVILFSFSRTANEIFATKNINQSTQLYKSVVTKKGTSNYDMR